MDKYEYIAHHGIRGMRWGVRNYQNSDGSLTSLGRARYGIGRVRSSAGKIFKKASTSARVAGIVANGKISRAAERTSRSFSEGVGSAKYRIGSFLNTQSAEAERLRRYTNSIVWERAAKASVENLRRQREYRIRIDAAKQFMRASSSLRGVARAASETRFNVRNGLNGVAKSLTGSSYNYLKSNGRSRLARKAPEIHLSDNYSRLVNSWMDNVRTESSSAKRWLDIARGH